MPAEVRTLYSEGIYPGQIYYLCRLRSPSVDVRNWLCAVGHAILCRQWTGLDYDPVRMGCGGQ